MIEIWALRAARLNASKFLPLARRIEFQVGPGNHFAILWIQPLNSDLLENRFPLDLLTGNDLETLHHLPLPIEGAPRCNQCFEMRVEQGRSNK